MLQTDQQNIYDNIVSFLKSKKGGYKVINGVAGSGKTYLTSRIIEEISKFNLVLVTAPTNKALKVLKKECKIDDNGVTFKTLHAAFGLKPYIDRNGKQNFKVDKYARARGAEGYFIDILFVDEMSMIDNKLFDIIKKEVESRSIKVVFIGDRYQIPPVNYEDSIPCDKNIQIKYNMEVFNLDKVIRQAKGNLIIDSASYIRNNIKEEFVNIPLNNNVVKINNKDEMNDILNTLFNEDRNNPNYVKVLAWTNRTVGAFNNAIRKMLYPDSTRRIEVGEHLIVYSPIVENKMALFNTNDELIINSFEEQECEIDGKKYEYYLCEATEYDSDRKAYIKILTKEYMPIFYEQSQMIANYAKNLPHGSREASDEWKHYYNFLSTFADVDYGYACSVHKSQGSSINKVVICEYDINKDRKSYERNRIKYTAVTRAINKAYVI